MTTTPTMRLAVGAQTLNAAELMGFALVAEDCKEERSKMIANVMRVLATTVSGSDAYAPLMDVAADIEAGAKHNLEATKQAEAVERDAARREAQEREKARYGVCLGRAA